MTLDDLKALLATIERGWETAVDESIRLSGWDYDAVMDYHSEPTAHKDITEGRQATAALLQHVERMEIDNQRLRKLCGKAADMLDYEARPVAYTSKGKQMYKSTKKVYDELRTEALIAGGQPDTGANGEASG